MGSQNVHADKREVRVVEAVPDYVKKDAGRKGRSFWDDRMLPARMANEQRYLGVIQRGARKLTKCVHGLVVSGYLMEDGRFIFKRHFVDGSSPSVFIIHHEDETDEDYFGVPKYTSGF